MIEFGGVMLVLTLAGYVAARLSFLGKWTYCAGLARLLALWGLTCWVGYGTPLHVAAAMLLLAIVWRALSERTTLLMVFELAVTAGLVLYSGTALVVVYLVGLVVFDQLAARLLFVRFNQQQEPRVRFNRGLLLMGTIAGVVLSAHYYRAPVEKFIATHSLTQVADLVPRGAHTLWFAQRTVTSRGLQTLYWEYRYGGASESCAISFHGAARPGSIQGAAQTIASGAIRAGYRVFAIDHPGFGASPAPPANSPVDAWDPAAGTTAVLQRMYSEGCTSIVAVGHSQGVTEALRLFVTSSPALERVVVLGAGLYSSDPGEGYWHYRFHVDRGLAPASPDNVIRGANQLSRENWKLVRDLYYLNQEYCADGTLGQAYHGTTALRYVTFEQEHENLLATRETLWNCLSYPNRSRAQLGTDHYLDSLQIGELVLTARRSVPLVEELFAGAARPAAPP